MKTNFPLPFALRSLQKTEDGKIDSNIEISSDAPAKPREAQIFPIESPAPSGPDFGAILKGIQNGFVKNKKLISSIVGILAGLFFVVWLISFISSRTSNSGSSGSNYSSLSSSSSSNSRTRYGYINDKDGIRFRSGPGTQYQKLDLLSKGTRIEVLDTNGPEAFLNNARGRWYKIRYGGREGWIFGAFVDLE
ncbi:MAG: SH3 domain-containing protein [Leptospiraceae bacterium]|nr:SH3 domain-containing protein [Leptospiraceae bacterium]MCP5512187.1 SH3 domain-containing protein [Leptospiraceae bacterium]